MDYRLAIDPGDRHVGWAERFYEEDVVVGEWTPNGCIDNVRRRIEAVHTHGLRMELIVEEFVLYPDKAKDQAGSSFQTSQLIGALKLIAADNDVSIRMQSATIKKPMRRQLKARGIKRVATGANIHASDAELHLWHRILRAKQEEQ